MFLAGWGDNAQQEPLLPLHGSSSVSSRRLLIVGDPEVGKSTLLQMLCSSPSIGAGTGVSSISMNSLKTGVTRIPWKGSMHVTELLEVPGRSKHPRARSCLYVPADAILLVHNQAFPKSYTRLYVWLKEIQEALERGRSPGANTSLPPILVVGTHSPLTNGNNNQIGRCPIAEETGGFSISIDLMDPSSEPRLNDVLQGLWYRILG